MEQQDLYGKLFNTIPLYNESHLDAILDSLDKDNATTLLIQAVKMAYHQNVFSLGECEVISKSIRVLNRPEITEDTEEQKKDGE